MGGEFIFLACSHFSIFQALVTCLLIVVSLRSQLISSVITCQQTITHLCYSPTLFKSVTLNTIIHTQH